MIERIRRKMKEEDINCLILTEEANITWALGKEIFGYVFITQDSISIIASNAHRHQLEDYDAEFAISRDEYVDLLEEKSEDHSGKVKTDKESDKLEEIFEAEATDIIQDLRKIKTNQEIENIKKACKITSQALANVKKRLFEGINEFEAVANITSYYAERGVQDAFLTNGGMSLVNANCLTAHAELRERKIQTRDLVIVDSGCRVNNYCSDVTRTYSQNPSEENKKLFQDVKEIQEKILEEIEAGKQITELVELRDKLAEEKGYDPTENILYSLGHSLGIEVHEKPSLNRSAEGKLGENMVIAVEPGIHVPGIGGVRIEDTVLVKENSCEILSSAPKNL